MAKKRVGSSLIAAVLSGAIAAPAFAQHCARQSSTGAAYVVCRFDPQKDDIRLFLARPNGERLKQFGRLQAALSDEGQTLVFAMNAGMYRPDRSPVGVYVEDRVTLAPLNLRDCGGNFCLKPNGVFWVLDDKEGFRQALVTTTDEFAEGSHFVRYATQSGPMLVIGGNIHPRFLKESTSRFRRNGVGVTAAGEVVFAISDAPVTFYEFAAFFRDELKTPNALYFDGAISRVFAPELGRNEPGAAMGPIVGVVEKLEGEAKP